MNIERRNLFLFFFLPLILLSLDSPYKRRRKKDDDKTAGLVPGTNAPVFLLEVEGTALLFRYLSKKLDADICQKGRGQETRDMKQSGGSHLLHVFLEGDREPYM